jgi:exopolyphosphatase/guanosine-5'-triphosphate,3'-diphosphate pyrophosphatase
MTVITSAALDIGSNSVMTLLMQADSEGQMQVLDEFGDSSRLAAGAAAAHGRRLTATAMARTLAAAQRQLAILRARHRPFTLVAAATSAVREAPNGNAFMAVCQRELALERAPTILSSLEEAEIGFLGAAEAFAPGRSFINVDPGGGSTEISAGRPGQLRYARSLPIGCVACCEDFGLSEGVKPASLQSAVAAVYAAISAHKRELAPLRGSGAPGGVLSACGGTAAALGAVLVGQPDFERSLIHDRRCGLPELDALLARTASMDSVSRQALPGMPPGRARVFPAGLIILRSLMAVLGHEELIINCYGLRHGLIYMLQQGRLGPHLRG